MQNDEFPKFWDIYYDESRFKRFLTTLERHLSRGSGERLSLLPTLENEKMGVQISECAFVKTYVADGNAQINRLLEVGESLEGLGSQSNLQNDLDILEDFWKNPPRIILETSYAQEETRKYREVPSRLSKALKDIHGDNFDDFVNQNVEEFILNFKELGVTP